MRRCEPLRRAVRRPQLRLRWQVQGANPDRPRGLLATSDALFLLEPAHAWDAALDAIKAANSTEGFTGEGGGLSLRVNSKSLISTKTEPVPDFDVGGIFGKLARSDYDRAIDLVRGFQGEAPRINATIAISRSVLSDQNTPAAKPPSGAKN